MGILSANTLFHYTGSKENLIGILKGNFELRLCVEEDVCSKGKKWAIPMVCFCDIPLSQISDHTKKYGSYALGLKKEWAIANNILPLTYTYADSSITKLINLYFLIGDSGLNIVTEQEENEENEYLANRFMELLISATYNSFFIKPYIGKQKIGDNLEDVRFYDEREWRYTIPFDTFKDNENLFYLSGINIDNKKSIARINTLLKKYCLIFEPKDINYIIVPTEDEVLEIKDEVERIKGNFPHNDVKLLSTRILSMERIREDF